MHEKLKDSWKNDETLFNEYLWSDFINIFPAAFWLPASSSLTLER